MIKFLKEKLYFLKQWHRDIFLYPKDVLDPEDSLDYDKYWETKRGESVGVLTEWQKLRADIVANQIGKDEVTIGDFGCGEGSILKYLMDKLNIKEALGYDSSEFVLSKAKQIDIKTCLLDMNREEDFEKVLGADYFLLLEVLEHTPHSEKVLSAVYKKAKKGVFFSIPNSGYFTHRFRLLFGKSYRQWRRMPNEHLRFWTMSDMKWWLKALGYKSYVITGYKGVPFLNKIWPSMFAAGQVIFVRK